MHIALRGGLETHPTREINDKKQAIILSINNTFMILKVETVPFMSYFLDYFNALGWLDLPLIL